MKKLYYYIFILFVFFTSCQAKKAQNRTNTNISVSIDTTYYHVYISKIRRKYRKIEIHKTTKNSFENLFTAFYNKKGKLIQMLIEPTDSGSNIELSYKFQDGRIKYIYYYNMREKTEKYITFWANREFFQFDKKGNLVGFYLIEDGKLKNLIYANSKSFNVFLKDFKHHSDLTIDSVWYNKKFETPK